MRHDLITREDNLLEEIDNEMLVMDWPNLIEFTKRLLNQVYSRVKNASNEHHLWGFIQQAFNMINGQLEIIRKHQELGISFNTKADVQSFECRLKNYENMRKENEQFKEKIRKMSEALND